MSTTSKPIPHRPPPPVPKRGHVKVVQALYTYTAQNPEELSFEEGDVLYITEENDSGWWKGKCAMKSGLIPSNYVEEHTEMVQYPMHEAARRGNFQFLTECIKNGVSVNALDKSGSTPVHWASHAGHIQCLEALLAVNNIEINVQNRLGDTPLHSASWKGHVEAVKMLIEKGATTDVKNKDGKLPSDLTTNSDILVLLQTSDNCQDADDYLNDSEESDSD